MSDFNIHAWKKNQYLAEAGLGSSQAQSLANLIDDAIMQVDESLSYRDFAIAVGIVLKEEYGSHNFGKFMEVLHAELGMEESLNEVGEMATYKVEVVLADPYEGGPDYAEDVEVKIDASLSGDKLKSAVRDALYDMGYTRRSIYKINYEKA